MCQSVNRCEMEIPLEDFPDVDIDEMEADWSISHAILKEANRCNSFFSQIGSDWMAFDFKWDDANLLHV